MTTIRKKFDAMFPAILEKNKLMGLAMKSHLDFPTGLVRNVNENLSSYSGLMELMEHGTYTYDSSMSMYEKFITASLMTIKLAGDLDSGDTRLVTAIGRALEHFDMEIILITVRCNIQIERLVKFNLDEHIAWADLLNNINKAVDYE